MNLAALFAGGIAAGIAAGTTSCAAVQGGLLVGVTRSGSAVTAVGAFVAGRLGAHIAAGALLGLVGSAVQPSPRARAALLVAAGVAVLIMALRLLGKPRASACGTHAAGPHTSLHAHTEASPQTGDRPLPRHRNLSRALALGLATILVPCGVTVSLEVVAVSTGSALDGAAILGGFALGTTPAFAALGLLLRGLASARLAAVAGVVALAAGAITVVSGLRLGGWLSEPGAFAAAPAPAVAPADAQAQAAPAATSTGVPRATATGASGGYQRVTVWATREGFRPGLVTAAAGRPTDLVFRTNGNDGCTRSVVIGDRDVVLPVTGEVTVRLPPQPAGRLRYACGMGMFVGFISFEPVRGPQSSSQ
ncbi:sulfite exporter TauE/SafE family protein [Microbispora sp. RL4-1S]|uniref:Sulfite exporter TauE/SafE family protein n=1 Tax=Microbispora oryzae TaxID=2806554 RepID=A0A940WJ52_9ACTN|nr:sulfite exporter TauE/SafE family protein [Microbispora oryzae]MBP2705908.1 sulfite exporter TauE/SafE family protein [Microbispora oryzae]